MKVAWQVTGSPNLFKLTPPWRREDEDVADMVIIMFIDEETYDVYNAENMNLILTCQKTKLGEHHDKVMEYLGWPVAGTADIFHSPKGPRFIFTVKE